MTHFYEVYHWQEMAQYNKETKTGGLFSGYVNGFLKIKQEASGWPDWCVTNDDKSRYISMDHEREGILLDKDKIQKNSGLRSLAKLMLNSFWG